MYGMDTEACSSVSSQKEDRVPDVQPPRVPNPLEQPLADVEMAGIFDIKWCPALALHAVDPVLATALADGRVSLMHLEDDQCGHAAQPNDVRETTAAAREPGGQGVRGDSIPRATLHELSAAAVEPDGNMVLSLDWSSRRHDGALLVTSTSSGAVATLQVGHWGEMVFG